jgi:DNA repair exonuclease SbcCD ATPase subunit
MGKKELRKKMRTLDERIREHEAKILVERELDQPNEGRIRHWEGEIRAFRSAIDRARKRLGEMR